MKLKKTATIVYTRTLASTRNVRVSSWNGTEWNGVEWTLCANVPSQSHQPDLVCFAFPCFAANRPIKTLNRHRHLRVPALPCPNHNQPRTACVLTCIAVSPSPASGRGLYIFVPSFTIFHHLSPVYAVSDGRGCGGIGCGLGVCCLARWYGCKGKVAGRSRRQGW